MGDPFDSENRLGPVIQKSHMETILSYIKTGREEGADLLCGGTRALEETGGYYVTPTVFDQVNQGMRIAREEIIGPVLSIMTFEDADQAITMANDTSYGLQASVWSDNVNHIYKLARGIRAGVVSVNNYSDGDLTTPFGGFKQSGFMGRDKSLWANRQYTEMKSVYIKINNN